jgi:hypothetical protein
MKIINLIDFSEITETSQPAEPVKAMFIEQQDASGAPQVYTVKMWYPSGWNDEQSASV